MPKGACEQGGRPFLLSSPNMPQTMRCGWCCSYVLPASAYILKHDSKLLYKLTVIELEFIHSMYAFCFSSHNYSRFDDRTNLAKVTPQKNSVLIEMLSWQCLNPRNSIFGGLLTSTSHCWGRAVKDMLVQTAWCFKYWRSMLYVCNCPVGRIACSTLHENISSYALQW